MGTVSEIGPRFDNHAAPNIGFYRNEKIVARIYNINDTNLSDTRNPDDQVRNILGMRGTWGAIWEWCRTRGMVVAGWLGNAEVGLWVWGNHSKVWGKWWFRNRVG